MKSRRINIDGVGDVLLERSVRAKYLNLSVRPFEGARVAVPPGITFASAAAFAASKAAWIKNRLQSMSRMEQCADHVRRTKPFDPRAARRQLIERTEILAARHGFSFRRIFIRRQRTRWGSCSHQNNINLNINLVLLPPELTDYIILHELVHTRVKHHGPAFWRELGRLVHRPRELDRRYAPVHAG